MDALTQYARRAVGLPEFERKCRRVDCPGGTIPAYRVPGTQEAGQYAMLTQAMQDRLDVWRQNRPYAGEMPTGAALDEIRAMNFDRLEDLAAALRARVSKLEAALRMCVAQMEPEEEYPHVSAAYRAARAALAKVTE